MMRFLKKSFPFAVGLVSYFVVNALFFDTATATEVDPSQLEQALLRTEQGELFNVVKSEFPVEFRVFLQELAAVVDQKYANKRQKPLAVQTKGAEFAAGLRRQNAHYLRQAPAELLRALQESKLELMLTTQNDRALCTRVANYGPAGLSENEFSKKRIKILSKGGVLFFESAAAGRNHPVQRGLATQTDYAAFLAEWRNQPEVTSSMYEALMQNDASSDDFCASAISFQRFLSLAKGNSAERILADLSAEADSY